LKEFPSLKREEKQNEFQSKLIAKYGKKRRDKKSTHSASILC